MGLNITFNILYDPKKDIYFINGHRSEVNEKKSLIDPTALFVRALDFSSRQFENLQDATTEIKAMEMNYVVRNYRPGETKYDSFKKSKES